MLIRGGMNAPKASSIDEGDFPPSELKRQGIAPFYVDCKQVKDLKGTKPPRELYNVFNDVENNAAPLEQDDGAALVKFRRLGLQYHLPGPNVQVRSASYRETSPAPPHRWPLLNMPFFA